MKNMILVLTFLALPTFSAFAAELNCQAEAHSLVATVSRDSDFDANDYQIKLEEGVFASEPTEIYLYYKNVLDSWKVELVKEDCFPIGINFIGDL